MFLFNRFFLRVRPITSFFSRGFRKFRQAVNPYSRSSFEQCRYIFNGVLVFNDQSFIDVLSWFSQPVQNSDLVWLVTLLSRKWYQDLLRLYGDQNLTKLCNEVASEPIKFSLVRVDFSLSNFYLPGPIALSAAYDLCTLFKYDSFMEFISTQLWEDFLAEFSLETNELGYVNITPIIIEYRRAVLTLFFNGFIVASCEFWRLADHHNNDTAGPSFTRRKFMNLWKKSSSLKRPIFIPAVLAVEVLYYCHEPFRYALLSRMSMTHFQKCHNFIQVVPRRVVSS